MSDRVILQFGTDEGEEPACSESDCANRWRCMLHAATAADAHKCFRPSAELVVVAGKGTLTCHDYWQGKGESDGGSGGR